MTTKPIAVEIHNIGKRYSISHRNRPDSIKSWIKTLAAPKTSERDNEDFWALKDVSLTLGEGDCLALVGKNGSGKSTLLKILSRITPPTCGHIRIQGRMAALLEVGTGFHPDLTGRENIFLNGAMLGCSARDIKVRFDSIVDFSGVERFLDTPVKHYSSGMYVRLAYAIAAHVDADIFVIDEVLAVGDTEFQEKCIRHLKATLAEGKSAILVSHDLKHVQQLASHIAWLEQGRLLDFASLDSNILDRYHADVL